MAYIHEPWNAPAEVQRMANCVIGQDYPLRMVDHAKAAEMNGERMAHIYKQLPKNGIKKIY